MRGAVTMARRRSISHSPSGDQEDTLRKEVASLLSAEVGLGAHATPDDAFDDFAPQNAAKKLGDVENLPKRVKKSTNKFKPTDHQAAPRNPAEARKPELDASITERGWNEGAGQRPGGKGKVLVDQEDSTVWHEAASVLPKLTDSSVAATDEVVQVKTSVAQKLIEVEAERYQKKLSRTNASDAQWLRTVRKSGTTRDQIAANALLVEQSAVHNVMALDELISLASKRGGAQAAAGHAVDALKQLFIENLLPDRRLIGFDARPLQCVKPSRAGDKQLLYWWVEDCIKRRYSTFVQALEDLSLGNLDWAKQKALKAAHELLAAKPEQEARLLTIMVNKLGDPSRRMASNAGYLISCLLTEHPLMSAVVVREIERFLFRPNQKTRAVYYAVITLNQMVLSHHTKHGSPVAKRLIDIYFTLFHLVLDHKMGNAAQQMQPKADTMGDPSAEGPAHDTGADSHSDQEFDEGDMEDAQAHGKKKLSASASRKASFLAKRKGRRVAKGRGGRSGGARGKGKYSQRGKAGVGASATTDASDKVVSAEVADARMLSALIAGVRRAYPYVDSAELEDVFAKHANHLFRTVHVAPLTVSVQALMLLFQVMTSQSAVNDRFHNALYAVLLRPGLSTSSTLPMLFGLLFQALSADVSTRRIAAFIKRMLQFAASAPANVTCGVLVVVSEVLKKKPALWGSILQPEDEGVEQFQDAEEPATDADAPVAADSDRQELPAKSSLSSSDTQNARSGDVRSIGKQWPPDDYYDITKRAPQFARAERACWWELCGLRAHVHPSVAAMAGALLAGTSVVYDGDPLGDLTVLAFLDKFVKRKPKRGDKGQSAMQPVTAEAAEESMLSGAAQNVSSLKEDARPGSTAFAALAAQDVKAEDVFFHKYFTLEKVRKRRVQVARTKALMKKKKKSGEEGSDEEMWEEDGDDVASQEDDSAAEDDFLEGLETMQDDALGDPDAGGLSAKLLAEMAAAGDGAGEENPEYLEEADITEAREISGSGSDAVDEFDLHQESSPAGDIVGSDEDDFDDDALDENALFGAGSDLGFDDDDVSDLDDDEPSHIATGKAQNSAGKPQKKRKESGEMLASYEQYAHLLEQYDEVNKQELPDEELKGGRGSKQKRKMKRSGVSKRRKLSS